MENSLPPINVSPSKGSKSTDKVHRSPPGERLSASVTKQPLLRNDPSSRVGGGVLRYLSPQPELFSHFDSPKTQSRELSPAFSCGKAKEPEDVYGMSPRGDIKPEHRPYSQSFLVGNTLKYEDSFVLTPGEKASETRPHSPAFLSGAFQHPERDDFFVLSPRKNIVDHAPVSNMRCGVNLEHDDAFMLEPSDPVAATFRAYSPAFLGGAVQRPDKDDIFVLTPSDPSEQKARDRDVHAGPGMRLGGALPHTDDTFLLEPSPAVPLSRPQSSPFLCGHARQGADDAFSLTPSDGRESVERVGGMRAGGHMAHNDDVFGSGDPYSSRAVLGDRPLGGMMRTGGAGGGSERLSSEDNALPETRRDSSAGRDGFLWRGVESNAIDSYWPGENPAADEQQTSRKEGPMMKMGTINRSEDVVYTPEGGASHPRQKEVSNHRGMRSGQLARDSDLFYPAEGSPGPTYDRETPHFSHRKFKKGDGSTSQPLKVKQSMKISVTVPHQDEFVFKGGGAVVERGRDGSSLTIGGKAISGSTMDTYEGPGVAPMARGGEEARGMKVGSVTPHESDVFAVNGSTRGMDIGRVGSCVKSGAVIRDDSMEKYVSSGSEAVLKSTNSSRGMNVSSAIPHNGDLFALSPSVPAVRDRREVPTRGFKPQPPEVSASARSVGFYESPYKQDPLPVGQESRTRRNDGSVHHKDIKSLGNIKHSDAFCNEYDGVSKEMRDIRPQSDSFLAGSLKREKDAVFVEPSAKNENICREYSKAFSTSPVKHADVFALISDDKAEGMVEIAEHTDDWPCIVSPNMKREDIFLLEPNKMSQNVTRKVTYGFLAGVVLHTDDIFYSVYDPPVRPAPEESNFCVRHIPGPDEEFSYDLEYYVPPPPTCDDGLEVFNALGLVGHRDEYYTEYDGVSKEVRDMRPQSDSFLAGSLKREKDAVFVEPSAKNENICREYSKAFSTSPVKHADVFALKYDENAANPKVAERPYSSPYLVSVTVKREDKFLLEPNKSSHATITRDAGTPLDRTKKSFVAGSARLMHDDFYVREPYQAKPSISRDFSSSFVTCQVAPSDIYFTDPVAKPRPRPVTVHTSRPRAVATTASLRGRNNNTPEVYSVTSHDREEKLREMLSSIVELETGAMGDSHTASASSHSAVSASHDKEPTRGNSTDSSAPQPVVEMSSEMMVSETHSDPSSGNGSDGPETEGGESSLSNLESIKSLVFQQRKEWELKMCPTDSSDSRIAPRRTHSRKPPKQKKNVNKAKERQKRLAAEAKRREERKSQKVMTLLSAIVEQSGKKSCSESSTKR